MKAVSILAALAVGGSLITQPAVAQGSPCLCDSATATPLLQAVKFNYSRAALVDSLLPKVAATHISSDSTVCASAVNAYNSANGLMGPAAISALYVVVVPDIAFVVMRPGAVPGELSTMIYFTPDWTRRMAFEP